MPKKAGLIGLLTLSLLLAAPSLKAMPMNGDFSAGFTGWAGEVTDIFFTTTPVDPLPGAFSGNFDASSGAAVLTTSTLTDDIFSVFMFQTFMVESAAAGETLELSYDLTAALSDAGFGDLAFAQLNHGAGFGMTIDLLAATSVDITFLAGTTVEFLFGVEDFDDLSDSLTVDNILITKTAAQIPEPGTLGLVLAGLLVIGRSKFLRSGGRTR